MDHADTELAACHITASLYTGGLDLRFGEGRFPTNPQEPQFPIPKPPIQTVLPETGISSLESSTNKSHPKFLIWRSPDAEKRGP